MVNGMTWYDGFEGNVLGEDRLTWGLGGGVGGVVGSWSNEEGKQLYKKHILKMYRVYNHIVINTVGPSA